MNEKVSLSKEFLPWHLLTESYNRYDAFGEVYNYVLSYSKKSDIHYLRKYDKQGVQIGSEKTFKTFMEATDFANEDNERSKNCTKQE